MENRISGIIERNLYDLLYNRYKNQSKTHGFINICDDENCYVYYIEDEDKLVYVKRLENKVESTVYRKGKYIRTFTQPYIEV